MGSLMLLVGILVPYGTPVGLKSRDERVRLYSGWISQWVQAAKTLYPAEMDTSKYGNVL